VSDGEEIIRVLIDVDDDGSRQGHDDDDAARRAAEAAEADLRQARQERDRWTSQLAARRAETAMAKVEQKRAEADAAASDMQHAADYGDPIAAAEAQRRLIRSEAEQVRFQAEAEAIQAHVHQHVQQAPSHGDPVEAMISRCTPETAAWYRKNPEFARDAATNGPRARKLDAAHATALERGLAPDTEAYFDHAEKYLGLRDGRGTRHQVAEVDLNNPHTHVRDGGKRVVLTAGEAKSARDGTLVWNTGPRRGQPIGIQEMARRKAAILAEGHYDRLD